MTQPKRESSARLLRLQAKSLLTPLLTFIAWSFVFALIYAQSPLYTSNQNQYFLHGLAQAGFGFLRSDWLANTMDPTPLFSQMVSLTYRVFRTDILFYAYYALLLGIYLYSLLGIASRIFNLSQLSTKFAYLALLLVIHSAGLRFFLSRVLGPEWAYLLEGGVANQRVLGAVFQPSTFGVLLLLSIYLFLVNRGYLALVPMAVAVSFHPTYLLSAAVLTLAYMWAPLQEERNWVKSLSIGGLALVLVVPILGYVFASFGATPAETTAQARDILVHYRIPHHAVISEWFDLTTILQTLFILTAIYLVRHTRLFSILFAGFLIPVLLTILQLATQSDAVALLFPWRISVILVPLSIAVITAYLLSILSSRFDSASARFQLGLRSVCLALMMLAALVGVTRFIIERHGKVTSNESSVLAFVAGNKSQGEIYLTPTKMQDFRLVTGAPAYIDFKSIPYRDVEVLEWYRRIQLANRLYEAKEVDCQPLEQLLKEGITHVILESEGPLLKCDSFQKIYADANFGVYSLEK
jgi:hypothetical protein